MDISSRLGSLRDGGLEVQYFPCPACGAKYHIFTTDSKLRDLITGEALP